MPLPAGMPRAIITMLLAIAGQSLITGPMLGALGFTAAGIQAGSVAASIQGAVGSVASRGVFATLQSAAMGGYGTRVISMALKVLAGMIAALGSCGDEDEDEDEEGLLVAA